MSVQKQKQQQMQKQELELKIKQQQIQEQQQLYKIQKKQQAPTSQFQGAAQPDKKMP
jgi:hypothetical protein